MAFCHSSAFCSPLHVQDGQTALYIASNNGHGEIVKLLLKREADLDHETKVSVLHAKLQQVWFKSSTC